MLGSYKRTLLWTIHSYMSGALSGQQRLEDTRSTGRSLLSSQIQLIISIHLLLLIICRDSIGESIWKCNLRSYSILETVILCLVNTKTLILKGSSVSLNLYFQTKSGKTRNLSMLL